MGTLVPDHRKKALFYPLEYVGLSLVGLYYVDIDSFYTPFVESFYPERILNYVKRFPISIDIAI